MKTDLSTLFSFVIVFFSCLACDTKFDIEETSQAICECTNEAEPVTTEKFRQCFRSIFSGRTILISDESKIDSLEVQLIKHLGRNCTALAEANAGIEPNSSFRNVDKDKESMLSIEECLEFSNHKEYYYVESWGDTTQVKITPETYTELFRDGSFSKLTFGWKEGCAFDIAFIESNNSIKKYASTKGEVYSYKLIDKDSINRQYSVYTYTGEFIIEILLNY